MNRKKGYPGIFPEYYRLAVVICFFLSRAVLSAISPVLPGPLYTKNLYSPFVPFLNISAEAAECLAPGEFLIRIAHNMANTFRVDYGEEIDNFIVDIDLENHNLNIDMSLGLFRSFYISFDISIEGSFYYQSGGILDKAIDAFHIFFNFPGSGRDSFASDRNHFIIGPMDNLWINSGEPGWEINNVLIKARFNFPYLNSKIFLLAIQPALKIPLPGAKSVFLNRTFDPALSVLMDIRFRYLLFYLNGGWLYAGCPVNIPSGYFGGHMFRFALGAEWRLLSNSSLNFLLSGITSPYKVPHRFLGFPSISLSTGVKVALLKGLDIQFGFSEELFFYGAADIQFFSSITSRINPKL